MALERAKRVIEKILLPESGAHAVLLYGPKGAGKQELANRLVESWLDHDRAIDSYRRGANPDVLTVAPIGKSSIIRVCQIKFVAEEKEFEGAPLTEFLRVGPLYSKNKVVIMHDCHRMNDASSNSLLKTLEEPPTYGKLILMTPTISAVKPTILSRCIVVACELPTKEEFEAEFSNFDVSLRELSDGSPGILTEMQKSPGVYLPFVWFVDDLAKAKPRDFLRLSSRFKELVDDLDEVTKLGARASGARSLEIIAGLITRRYPNKPQMAAPLIEAHRRILGNGNSALVFDSVFAEILVK